MFQYLLPPQPTFERATYDRSETAIDGLDRQKTGLDRQKTALGRSRAASAVVYLSRPRWTAVDRGLEEHFQKRSMTVQSGHGRRTVLDV